MNTMSKFYPYSQLIDVFENKTYPMQEYLSKLLNKSLKRVQLISYVLDYPALERIGFFNLKCEVQLILIPPNGIAQSDVSLLCKLPNNFKIKQISREKLLNKIIHYKSLIIETDKEFLHIIGSSNYTTKGIIRSEANNAELSVSLRSQSHPWDGFKELWDNYSNEISLKDFAVQLYDESYFYPPLFADFQLEKIDELTNYYKKSKNSKGCVLSMPTGTGKTITTVKFLLDSVLTNKKVALLWIAPNNEMLEQARNTFEALKVFWPKWFSLSENHNVIFSTLSGSNTISPQDSDAYKMIVVDEAHYGASKSNKLLPELRKRFPKVFFLGVTATPIRTKFQELFGLKYFYGNKRLQISKDEVLKKTHLGKPILAKVETILKETGFTFKLKDKPLGILTELTTHETEQFNTPERNEFVVNTYSRSHGKTLVFAVNTTHANTLANLFKQKYTKLKIQVVHSNDIGDTPSEIKSESGLLGYHERMQILEKINNGDIDVIISVNMYLMGVDFPKINTIFMARPTMSPIVYAQMVGRGLRGPAFGGTENINILDFVDQDEEHKKTLQTYESMINHSLEWEKQLDSIKRLKKRVKSQKISEFIKKNSITTPVLFKITTPGKELRRDWKYHNDINSWLISSMKSGFKGYDRLQRTWIINYLTVEDNIESKEVKKKIELGRKLEMIE